MHPAIYGSVALVALYALLRKKPISSGSTILVVGDSLGVGMSPELERLAKKSGYHLVSRAIVGSRIDQWASYIGRGLQDVRPALVIVSLGTNDSAMNEAAARAQKPYLDRLLVSLSPIRHVWILPPKLPASLASRDIVRAMIAAATSDTIDAETMTFERAPDGIHATLEGYKSWARQVWSQLFSRRDVS